ncbi:MAG: hypothetical protein WD645_03140 [Dehalococcoidia bacterium]
MSWQSGSCCGHHAGDIAVLAGGGPNDPIEERYYFAPPYHSGHGGASMQDGSIPLLLARNNALNKTHSVSSADRPVGGRGETTISSR